MIQRIAMLAMSIFLFLTLTFAFASETYRDAYCTKVHTFNDCFQILKSQLRSLR